MHIAYLAGLTDGEGSIMLLGQGPQRCRAPAVQIGVTDAVIPDALKQEFGGFVTTRARQAPRQDMHYWMARHGRALDLLRQLRPHLVMDRRIALADLLINDPVINDTRSRGRGASKITHNERVFRQMRALNGLRRDTPPKLSPSNPSDADFAYLAGILDGEGYVGPRVVEVSSTDPELPAWLAARFGGNVYARPARNERQRPQWEWKRSATGNAWAARVADHMLLERKAEVLRIHQDFKRGTH